MKILVYGAGAIGSFLGCRLTLAGEDVTVVARGAQHDALSRVGLILEGARSGVPYPVRVHVCQPGAESGPYDLIFVTLKSQQIGPVAGHLRSLAAPGGALVFPQNGLPWWYFQGIDSAWRDAPIAALDAGGVLRKAFPPEMIIGGVALKPSVVVSPGHLRVSDGDQDALIVGEIDDRVTPRVQAIADLVTRAGWRGKVTGNIREAKWRKLLSNVVWNVVGSITQSTPRETANFAGTRPLAVALMREVVEVAAAVGTRLEIDAEARVDEAAKRAPQPTSTLQDVRAGRPLEVDAIVNAVVELARMTGTPTPALDVVAACVNLLNERICQDRVAIRAVPVS